jgi:hypothetical protein
MASGIGPIYFGIYQFIIVARILATPVDPKPPVGVFSLPMKPTRTVIVLTGRCWLVGYAATAGVTAAADLTAAPNCSTAISPTTPARARPARMNSTSLIPIQAKSWRR